MGDLNFEGHNGFLKEFSDLYNLKNLIKVPTCFKKPDFPTKIYIMLATSYKSLIIHVQLKPHYQVSIR